MHIPLKSKTLSALKLSLIITPFLFNTAYSYSNPSNQSLQEKYQFNCEDPYTFLCELGIDVDKKNIIQVSDLQNTHSKWKGGTTGSVYRDQNGQIYYLKPSNPFPEIIGSQLMNLLVGTNITPTVKIVKDKPNYTASLKLDGFKTKKSLRKKRHKSIQRQLELTIAMDFIGLVDRHNQNQGVIISQSQKASAARIDFDSSFSFEIKPTQNSSYNPNSNHLNLRHLLQTIQDYPKKQVINAIKKIIAIPDEKIILTIFEGWVTLNRAGYPVELESCFSLANKLIERKNAFHSLLNSKKHRTNPLLKKQHYESFAAYLF